MIKESLINYFLELPSKFSVKEYFIPTLTIYMILILLYAVFTFYFYRFFAKKEIFSLNLEKFKKIKNIQLRKTRAFGLYTLKHFIILPLISFFWFAILALFLILLSKELSLKTILFVSASFVAAVRVASYIDERLSQDLAKMLPLTLLALILLGENFFSMSIFLQRIKLIPLVLPYIANFILFIVMVEVILRLYTLIINSFKWNKDIIEAENKQEKEEKKKE